MNKWECPICLESNFPMQGSCGHCVCEVCEEKIKDCPKCRKKNSFIKSVPSWELAGLCNIERKQSSPDPENDDLFCLNKSDLLEPVLSINQTAALFDVASEKMSPEKVSFLIRKATDTAKEFEDVYSKIVVPRLVQYHKKHKKRDPANFRYFKTKISVRKSPYKPCFLAQKLREYPCYSETTSDGKNRNLFIREERK